MGELIETLKQHNMLPGYQRTQYSFADFEQTFKELSDLQDTIQWHMTFQHPFLKPLYALYTSVFDTLRIPKETISDILKKQLQSMQNLSLYSRNINSITDHELSCLRVYLDHVVITKQTLEKTKRTQKDAIEKLCIEHEKVPEDTNIKTLAEKRNIRESIYSYGLTTQKNKYHEQEIQFICDIEQILEEVSYIFKEVSFLSSAFAKTMKQTFYAYQHAAFLGKTTSSLYNNITIMKTNIHKIGSIYDSHIKKVIPIHKKIHQTPLFFQNSSLQQILNTVGSARLLGCDD